MGGEQETLTGEQADEDVLLSQKKTQEIELKSDLLPELLDRMARIEQRQKKIIRIISGGGDYTRQEKKIELARAVTNSPSGLTTSEVKKIFDYTQSKNALELMRDLADEESKFKLHKKTTPYRIVHTKKHGIAGYKN